MCRHKKTAGADGCLLVPAVPPLRVRAVLTFNGFVQVFSFFEFSRGQGCRELLQMGCSGDLPRIQRPSARPPNFVSRFGGIPIEVIRAVPKGGGMKRGRGAAGPRRARRWCTGVVFRASGAATMKAERH